MIMAAASPGAQSGVARRVKKVTKPTATSKAHRFEPFSKRIARLKIDPIHRVVQENSTYEDDTLSKSHFRASLEHWNEFNQSKNYTDFSRKVAALCESLPQLLHHVDEVAGLLLEHVGQRDPLSLEALLDLVAQFAHDLGQGFEQYFSQTVTLVALVAASHEAPEVVEWSFKCLAWIFKFLSRLLVPDLRPLLVIMAPYLGKARQKYFVTRFAAESLAFLARKAAIMYPKNAAPLTHITSFLFDDLSANSQNPLLSNYQTGLMTLFAESAKGIDGDVHTSARYLFQNLLDHAHRVTGSNVEHYRVIEGSLVHLMHQSDAEGFAPLSAVIRERALRVSTDDLPKDVKQNINLLFMLVGTRKGTRVSQWPELIEAIVHVLNTVRHDYGGLHSLERSTFFVVSLAMLYAPMQDVLPFLDYFSQGLVESRHATHFLPVCQFFASARTERFQSLMLPMLQQFIVKRWMDDPLGLCALLENLRKENCVSPQQNTISYVACPSDWEREIARICSRGFEDSHAGLDIKMYAFLKLGDSIDFPRDSKVQKELTQVLAKSLNEALQDSANLSLPGRRFALGRGFQTFLDLRAKLQADAEFNGAILTQVFEVPATLLGMVPFLQGLSKFFSSSDTKPTESVRQWQILRGRLMNNLSHADNDIKAASLDVLKQLIPASNTWATDAIALALEIQTTTYNLQNYRRLSMCLRRLPQVQQHAPTSSIWRSMVPKFCFGLLSTFPGQITAEIIAVIAEMCSNASDEEIFFDVLTEWLHSNIEMGLPEQEDGENDAETICPSPFQCSNVLSLQITAQRSVAAYDDVLGKLSTNFERSHRLRSNRPPQSARLFALQVLKAVPVLAEKRSRLIVPLFLTQHGANPSLLSSMDSAESATSHTLSPEIPEGAWSFNERKIFLELVGSFVNPRVLFRSAELHQALLEMLKNGHSDMQKLALRALFTWKNPSIIPYEERLLRLLDDKTFRDQLATLFSADQANDNIDTSHRPGLLPVLLRLLFGRLISRSGSPGSQESKRKAILRTIFRLEHPEVSQFLSIAFGPLASEGVVTSGSIGSLPEHGDLLTREQRYGTLRMLDSMLDTMQGQLTAFGEELLRPVMYCTLSACRQLQHAEDNRTSGSAMTRSTRKLGINCLVMLFKYCDTLDWTTCLPILFKDIIDPRLPDFAIKTAQGVSGLLHLFATWSSSSEHVLYLQEYNASVLPAVYACLGIKSAKEQVKIFVLNDVVSNLARLAALEEPASGHAAEVLKAHMDSLADNLTALLGDRPSRNILDTAIESLSLLTPLINSSQNATSLLRALLVVIQDPHEKISPATKGNLVRSIRHLLGHCRSDITNELELSVFQAITPLFNYFKDGPNRALLSELMHVFAKRDVSLVLTAELCTSLNAQSITKLNNIDYDTRLRAFDRIRDLDLASTSAPQFQPVLFNLLYFSRVEDEFDTIRSNAVACLKSFIETSCKGSNRALTQLLDDVLLPALRKSAKENSEAVRADHVALFGQLVLHRPEETGLTDMKGLLAGRDHEEASFFNNVLHHQSHRRLRALGRLTEEVEKCTISSSNICTFFLPLLEKFIFISDADEAAGSLKGSAISAIRTLLAWTDWNQYKAIFRRYKSYMTTRPQQEKDIVKLLNEATDALIRAAEIPIAIEMGSESVPKQIPRLSLSLPSSERIAEEMANNFVPDLTAFVHHKDEAQMSLRLPAAVTIVKLLKLVSESQRSQLLPPLLLDVAYILRSRLQESRNTARSTLAKIATMLGPSSLGYILKELRTSLARGYQLHVLSYTVHSVLVELTPSLHPGDLDYCLESIVAVIMDDVFGAVGQEKDNEDYISQMKEVKSSKSFDTMEMLAKSAKSENLGRLVHPLQALLSGALSSKQSRQVDALLRSIGHGLSLNPLAGSRDLLVFSYEVVQQLHTAQSPAPTQKLTHDENNRQRYLVQLTGANKSTSGTNSPLQYKLAKFALEIVMTAFKRHPGLMTAENVHGFLPIIGDALIEAQEEVKISALRLLSTVVRLHSAELDKNAPLYIVEAVKVIKSAVSTNDESAQAALKLVAAILRECQSVEIRDVDLSYLLHRILPDLEEPEKQGVTFNFVKAVMARKLMTPEVYDFVDKIGVMMVTNNTRSSRDVARGVYMHFLLTYPQSKQRWSKQVKFLIKNLEYKYPEGRQTVMEAVHTLLTKVGSEVLHELVDAYFMPTVLLMANDDDGKCREMAGALLGQIFGRANAEQRAAFLVQLRSWIEQTENLALTELGLQAYQVLLGTQNKMASKEAKELLEHVSDVLETGQCGNVEDTWTSTYHALELFASIVAKCPAVAMSDEAADFWSTVRGLVSHPHTWIQSSVASLIGLLLADLAEANAAAGLDALPTRTSSGLELDADSMTHLLRASIRVLRQNQTSPDLSKQTVCNLAFLGRCTIANGVTVDVRKKPGQTQQQAEDPGSDSDEEDSPTSIPATEYLLHQMSSILRHEPPRLTTPALLPKRSALSLLTTLIPHIPVSTLHPSLHSLLLPLHHLTDPSIPSPTSTSPDFADAYTSYVTDAQELQDVLQKRVGDQAYVEAKTEVSKAVRERRQERRAKRAIEKVSQPERALRKKARGGERKKEVKRERGVVFRGRRRGW